jgi:hypothetical protein
MILKHPLHSGHWLSHQCNKIAPDNASEILADVAFTKRRDSIWSNHYRREFKEPKWRCMKCWKTAPDTIVGAYMLLEMDKASDQIQSALNNT